MTLANCKRLLAHYEKVGDAVAAADMIAHLASARGVTDDPLAKPKASNRKK